MFDLNHNKLSGWNPDPGTFTDTWDPRAVSAGPDVDSLVYQACIHGVVVVPAGASVGFSISDDDGGEVYAWTVSIRHAKGDLHLASGPISLRELGFGGVGPVAVREILEEAVSFANELVTDLALFATTEQFRRLVAEAEGADHEDGCTSPCHCWPSGSPWA